MLHAHRNLGVLDSACIHPHQESHVRHRGRHHPEDVVVLVFVRSLGQRLVCRSMAAWKNCATIRAKAKQWEVDLLGGDSMPVVASLCHVLDCRLVKVERGVAQWVCDGIYLSAGLLYAAIEWLVASISFRDVIAYLWNLGRRTVGPAVCVHAIQSRSMSSGFSS